MNTTIRSSKFHYLFNSVPFKKSLVMKAMKEYEDKTCVKFVPRRGEKDWVLIGQWGG